MLRKKYPQAIRFCILRIGNKSNWISNKMLPCNTGVFLASSRNLATLQVMKSQQGFPKCPACDLEPRISQWNNAFEIMAHC